MSRALMTLISLCIIILASGAEAADRKVIDASFQDMQNKEHKWKNVSVGPEGSSGSELVYLDDDIDRAIPIDSISKIEFQFPDKPLNKHVKGYTVAKIWLIGAKNGSQYLIKTATNSNKNIFMFGDNNNKIQMEKCKYISFNIYEQTNARPTGSESKGSAYSKPIPQKSTPAFVPPKDFPFKLGDIESIKPN